MPRISADSRATTVARDGGHGLPPPPKLTKQARALWRAIVDSKPADWFTPGSAVLLRQYCELAAQQDLLVARRRELDLMTYATSEDEALAQICAVDLEKRIHRHAATLSMLASKLRLSVQASIDRRSGKLDEPGKKSHPLLGGGTVTSLKRA